MVGRNLIENHEIRKYDLLLPKRKELDLSDFKATVNYISRHTPNLIIHAAGKVGGIIANLSEPVDFLVKNFDIGRNLILAARECGVRKLLNIGSSCMYPRDARNPLKEKYLLKGELEPTNEGYALAKIFALKLCEYISKEDDSFQFKTIIPCNLYGKFDKFNTTYSHMIPAVIMRIHEARQKNKNSIEIWGDAISRREFMYVEDLADFMAEAIRRFHELPSVINVGIGHDHTIHEYYTTIARIIGFKGEFHHDFSKPSGMYQKLVDMSKLDAFGWRYTTSLEKGIEKTYEYFLEMREK